MTAKKGGNFGTVKDEGLRWEELQNRKLLCCKDEWGCRQSWKKRWEGERGIAEERATPLTPVGRLVPPLKARCLRKSPKNSRQTRLQTCPPLSPLKTPYILLSIYYASLTHKDYFIRRNQMRLVIHYFKQQNTLHVDSLLQFMPTSHYPITTIQFRLPRVPLVLLLLWNVSFFRISTGPQYFGRNHRIAFVTLWLPLRSRIDIVCVLLLLRTWRRHRKKGKCGLNQTNKRAKQPQHNYADDSVAWRSLKKRMYSSEVSSDF